MELDSQERPGDVPFALFLGMVHILSRKGKSFGLKADSTGAEFPAPTPHK